MPEQKPDPLPVADIAAQLAQKLESVGCEYAIGGAVALACWAEPRGTVDLDVSLYLPIDRVGDTVVILQQIGAMFSEPTVRQSLEEHGFCSVRFLGRRLDVFLPIAAIYEAARPRRKDMLIANWWVKVWDAETLCVFKMMFFRRKDLADVESILRTQGKQLDTAWVEKHLVEMYGARDPRVSEWREIVGQCLGS